MTNRELLRYSDLTDKFERDFGQGKKVILKLVRPNSPTYLYRRLQAWHKTRPFIKQTLKQ